MSTWWSACPSHPRKHPREELAQHRSDDSHRNPPQHQPPEQIACDGLIGDRGKETRVDLVDAADQVDERLAAKVEGVGEARRTGGQPLVAALADFDDIAHVRRERRRLAKG